MSNSKETFFKHGDDYGIWKLRILGVMTSKGFHGMDLPFEKWWNKNVVDVRNLNKDQVAEKYKSDQERALSLLYRYMDSGTIKKMANVKTAQEAFEVMDKVYLKRGGVELVTVIHNLVTLKMKGSDVESYLTEFEGLLGELEMRGHDMPQVERALFMLCGIIEEWSYLRAQIFLQYGYEKLTIDVVKAALREHSAAINFGKMRVGEKEESGGEVALVMKMVICDSCGRRGHKRDNCDVKCWSCGKIGHVKSRCPNYGESSEGKGKRREVAL